MNSKLSTLFLSLLIFSSATLYGAAEGPYSIETCSPEIKQDYVDLVANFIQEKLPGRDTIIINNLNAAKIKLTKVNRRELNNIFAYTKLHLAKYYAGIAIAKPSTNSAYLEFVTTVCPLAHQEIDQAIVELNLHKTLLYLLGVNVQTLHSLIKTNIVRDPFFMVCIRVL